MNPAYRRFMVRQVGEPCLFLVGRNRITGGAREIAVDRAQRPIYDQEFDCDHKQEHHANQHQPLRNRQSLQEFPQFPHTDTLPQLRFSPDRGRPLGLRYAAGKRDHQAFYMHHYLGCIFGDVFSPSMHYVVPPPLHCPNFLNRRSVET